MFLVLYKKPRSTSFGKLERFYLKKGNFVNIPLKNRAKGQMYFLRGGWGLKIIYLTLYYFGN